MKKKFQSYESLFLALAEGIVGIILLLRPVGFTTAIIMTIGAVITVQGLLSIISYFRHDVQQMLGSHQLVKGLTLVAAGLFCLFKSEWFLAAFPVLTVLYGVLILLSGFYKLQWAVDMYRLKVKYWYVALISAGIALVLSALILINPFTTTNLLWIIVGATMVVGAVMDIVAFLFKKK